MPTTAPTRASDRPHVPVRPDLIERIRQRAYELYLARGSEPGHEDEDWLRAEHELQTSAGDDRIRSSFPAEAGDPIAERERENEIVRQNARGSRRARPPGSARGDAPGVQVTAGHGKDAHSVDPEEDFEIDGVDPAARSRRAR